MTAGHCLSGSDSSKAYWHHSSLIGTAIGSTHSGLRILGDATDWLMIPVASGNWTSTQSNRGYDTNANPSFAMTAVKPVANMNTGDYVYKSGLGWKTWGTHFGHVTATFVGYSLESANGVFVDLVGMKTDIDVSGGDSGSLFEIQREGMGHRINRRWHTNQRHLSVVHLRAGAAGRRHPRARVRAPRRASA